MGSVTCVTQICNLSHAEARREEEHAERKVSHRGTEGTENSGPWPQKRETEGTESDLRSLTPQTLKDSQNSERLIDSENILLNLQMPPRLCVRFSLPLGGLGVGFPLFTLYLCVRIFTSV